jgi:hypothetical protein
MEATVSFWVIPWRVIGISIIIGILVVIGLWSSFGKFKNSIQKFRGKKV